MLVLVAAFLTLSSCEQNQNILTEYEGVNLVANKGFDSPDWAPDQGSTHMRFEEATGFDPPADAAGAAVYRLEVKNLVEDGDFEASSEGGLPDPAWSKTGSGGSTFHVDQIPGFDGNWLYFDVLDLDQGDTVEFDLTTVLDGYPEHSNYILRFCLKADTAKTYWFYFPEYNSDKREENSHTADIRAETVPIINLFPDDFAITTSEFTSTAGSDAFYITKGVQSGYIDDFRVVRTDIPLRLRITLPWADPERREGLPLLSGWYEFSVWVKSDPAAATTPNSFAGNDVTIGVENGITVFPGVDTPVSLSNWTRVSTVFFVQIDAPVDPNEHVLELSVSPTDLKYSNSRDVGSLLITAPSLELHSSGPSTLQ